MAYLKLSRSITVSHGGLMKNPWKNPLKPLFGCAAIFAVIGLSVYANMDHPLYYQSNFDDGRKNDCMFTNDDYIFSMVYCGSEWLDSVKICNYFKSTIEQKDCHQASSVEGACNGHRDDLDLIHVCLL